MSSVEISQPVATVPAVAPRRAAAVVPGSVFLPKEHGSWSLALEPLALGLLLAPSAPGVALCGAAMAGFFIRRPLKAARGAASPRRREARRALALLFVLLAVAGIEVLLLGDLRALWPVLLALPCGALFAYFDAQGEGRAAAAEIAGSATFAVLPAVFATLDGWSAGAALSLAVIALVRSVPTVLTVRTFLRQRKGESASSWVAAASAALGLVALVQLAALDLLPWIAATGAIVLFARTLWLVGPFRPAWTARRAGMVEAILGLAYCGFFSVLTIGSVS